MRLFVAALAAFWVLLAGGQAAAAAAAVGPPPINGKAAVLIHANSGQILYQLNPTARVYPASTTKILTALVAAESGRLAETVTASARASGVDGTSCYLQPNEEQTLADLTACLMVASGNDAAVAIAEHLAGSVPAFADLMNRRAAAAGATQSHFTNPHGLHERQHYTTALDLARIAREALRQPDVRRMGGLKEFTLKGPEPKPRVFRSHNVLLWDTPGLDTGKIGFTEEAGHTIVVLAERNGVQLVAAVLGYNHQGWMFQHTEDLINWGFATFVPQDTVKAGQPLTTVAVENGTQEEVAVAPAGDVTTLGASGVALPVPVTTAVMAPERVQAPVAAGQVLGLVEVRQGDVALGRVDLVASAAVGTRSILSSPALAGTIRTGSRGLAWTVGGLLAVGTLRTFNRLRRRRAQHRGALSLTQKLRRPSLR